MHELNHDFSTLGVHSVRDKFPAVNLRLVKNPWNSGISKSIGRWRSALGDDQASTGSLAVIKRHEFIGRVGLDGAASGHG